MRIPANIARGVLASLILGSTLACVGGDWFASGDLEDVDASVALERGYTVPAGASHVYVHDRGTLDVRLSWMRYDLPPAEAEAIQVQLRADPGVVATEPRIPPEWPDLSVVATAPSWWAPSGVGYRRDTERHGTFWAFGDGRAHVYLWSTD